MGGVEVAFVESGLGDLSDVCEQKKNVNSLTPPFRLEPPAAPAAPPPLTLPRLVSLRLHTRRAVTPPRGCLTVARRGDLPSIPVVCVDRSESMRHTTPQPSCPPSPSPPCDPAPQSIHGTPMCTSAVPRYACCLTRRTPDVVVWVWSEQRTTRSV